MGDLFLVLHAVGLCSCQKIIEWRFFLQKKMIHRVFPKRTVWGAVRVGAGLRSLIYPTQIIEQRGFLGRLEPEDPQGKYKKYIINI